MKLGFVHALQITTLAVWLSGSVGSLVGYSVQQTWHLERVAKPKRLVVQTSIDLMESAEVTAEETLETDSTTEDAPSPSEPVISEPIAPPPPMPAMVEMTSLPEIPDLPAPEIRKTAQRVSPPRTPTNPPKQASSTPAKRNPGSASAKPSNQPPSAATSLSFGSGAGRQPAPAYPLQARRSNQQGTVVVEFIVGADGKVLSAWVKTPSAYPLLNSAALSTIRSRWKFPTGAARRYKIPIVFRLN